MTVHLLTSNLTVAPAEFAGLRRQLTNRFVSPDSRLRCSALLLLGIAITSSGCMHRRLTVRSDPPGANVVIDGEEVGYTPVSIDYTYYGTREVTLRKDGFKTLTTPVKLSTPWYQIFPLDFVSDNFALTKINDRREVTYALVRENLEPSQDVENRANGLRSEALRTEMPFPGGGR
jgi:hypothetical protein